MVTILGMHTGIAVVMGLPFFSGIMASADAVLVSSATWLTIQRWLYGVWNDRFRTKKPSLKISEKIEINEKSAEKVSSNA